MLTKSSNKSETRFNWKLHHQKSKSIDCWLY